MQSNSVSPKLATFSHMDYNLVMQNTRKESLADLKTRVKNLEKPMSTSPVFKGLAIPILIAALLCWVFAAFSPGLSTPMTVLLIVSGLLLFVLGIIAVYMKYVNEHSETMETSQREQKIKERSSSSRCIYLEGKVSDSKGTVGRCRLYDFDMIEYPYCIYCKEYNPVKGNPDL